VVVSAALVASACGGQRSLLDVITEVGPTSVRGALTVTPIEFMPLFDPPVQAERGRLVVPMRHGEPDGATISIHYVRFPARTDNPAAPIVYLAGGPGGSGTASSAGDRFPLVDALRDVADVIALDQRGTWNAEPYTICPGSWDYPLDRPLDEDALADAVAPWVRDCHRHWTEQGLDLDAFNTRESAADLEALRTALGADRLNLLAISYGTHLALEFMRSYPGSVERAVLAGIEGPDHTLKSPARIDATLDRTDAYLVERGMEPLTPRAGEVVDRVRDGVTARARAADGREIDVTLGALDAQIAIFGGAGERADLLDLSEALDATLAGDYSRAARSFLDWRTGNRGIAMSLAMDCSSWASSERLDAIATEAAVHAFGNAADLLTRAQCRAWPGARLGDGYHAPVRSDVPTLFVSGALDIRTPLENALEVADGFTRAWHLVIADGGHDDDLLLLAPETPGAIARFLSGADPEAPRREIRISN
jgi:pimeloyl-ACP methyl ester carboxylesterase